MSARKYSTRQSKPPFPTSNLKPIGGKPCSSTNLFRDKIAYAMRWACSQMSWRWTSGSIQSAATGTLSSVGPAALREPTIFSDAILAMLKANRSRQWPLRSRQEFPHDSCTSTIIELIIPKGSPAYVNRVIDITLLVTHKISYCLHQGYQVQKTASVASELYCLKPLGE